jgi:hypothetical protein
MDSVLEMVAGEGRFEGLRRLWRLAVVGSPRFPAQIASDPVAPGRFLAAETAFWGLGPVAREMAGKAPLSNTRRKTPVPPYRSIPKNAPRLRSSRAENRAYL